MTEGTSSRFCCGGYGLGVGTNLLLAFAGTSLGGLLVVVVCSGIYIAVEETLEKAVAAEALPQELRSLGFGFLACANAIGDMVSSLYIGYFLEHHQPVLAFGMAAAYGAGGVAWLTVAKVQQCNSRSSDRYNLTFHDLTKPTLLPQFLWITL